jgi:hypothetical protein
MGQGAQVWFTIALAIAGGVLLVYWLVSLVILLLDPDRLHRR